MKRNLILLTAVLAILAGCKEKPGANEPGGKLLQERCGRCHPTGVKNAHTTKEEWDATVTRMMGKGAALNADEKAMLVDFLVKYYQPKK